MMIYLLHGSLINYYNKVPIARVLNLFSNDMINIEANFFYSFDLIINFSTFFIFSSFISFM